MKMVENININVSVTMGPGGETVVAASEYPSLQNLEPQKSWQDMLSGVTTIEALMFLISRTGRQENDDPIYIVDAITEILMDERAPL